MSTPAKSENTTGHGAEVNVTPGFEEKLNEFWTRNRRGLLTLAAVVLVAIVARGGWDYMAAQKEREVGRNYAAAKTTDQLRSFAQANAGHELAGVAWLQVGDTAYAEGKASDAATAYQESRKSLAPGPLADRAALGLAMSQLRAGQTAEGKTGLKQLADATTVSTGIRTEAAYHLASMAHTAGDDVAFKQLAEQIMQIDPASPWAQRVMTLQVSKAATSAVATTPAATPAETTPASGDSVIKLNLGK